MLPEAVAAALACCSCAAAFWTNRKLIGWLPDDPPRPGRKQHGRPIPLAGIVLVPAVLPWSLAAGEWWLSTAIVIAAGVGFVDDRGKEHGRDLDWRWKAVGLWLAAIAGALAVVDPRTEPLAWFGCMAFLFVLTNATNFLDNTDGVAIVLSAVSLAFLTGGTGPAGAVAWAALGFLPWNWPRRTLFLGDAGAFLLGIVVGVAAARQATHDARALWCVAVQLGDFMQVVTVRLLLSLPPWVGDRRHLTHIAQNLGLPRVGIAPLFAVLAALGCVLAR